VVPVARQRVLRVDPPQAHVHVRLAVDHELEGVARKERGGGSGVTRAHERKRESRERAGGGEPLESRWRAVGEPLESGPAEEGSIRAVGSEGAVSPFAREPLESR
jgi:hypothetical protein